MGWKSDIKESLKALKHLHKANKPWKWYAGITNDDKRRLREHGVDIKRGDWFSFECKNDQLARDVEVALHAAGYQGGPGGGHEGSVWVYVYRL